MLLFQEEHFCSCTCWELIGECMPSSEWRQWWNVSAVWVAVEVSCCLICDVRWTLLMSLKLHIDVWMVEGSGIVQSRLQSIIKCSVRLVETELGTIILLSGQYTIQFNMWSCEWVGRLTDYDKLKTWKSSWILETSWSMGQSEWKLSHPGSRDNPQ